ncbi:MAG TPA: AmmeMemoRadiSam system protein A [Kofleriaceae bacterium]|nr:AmmeMemoRadiSam system protein A [Kofleriaceae bacterium]
MRTRGPVLAAWARAHLREHLGGARAVRPDAAWGAEPAATFVTLRWRDGRLQGCIGTLAAVRGIVDDVAHHVVAAALHDPRTEPIAIGDIDRLDLEISLLSRLEPIAFASEAELHAAIRPGIDGLVLEHRATRATLLPVMWEHLPDVAGFLAALKHKAGLSRTFFDRALRMSRYTAERYVDPAPEAS